MAGLLRRAAPLARRLTAPHPLAATIPIRPFRAAAFPDPSRAPTKLPSAASSRHPDLLRIARRHNHGDSSAVAGLEQRITRLEADLANHVSRLEVDLVNNTARIEVYVDHKVVALEVKVEEVCLGRHKEVHAWHTAHAQEVADVKSSVLALKTAAHAAEVRAAQNHVQALREIGKISWRVVWTVGLGAMTFTFGIIQVVRSESKTEYLRSADEQMRRHTQELHKMFLEHLESTVQRVVELALAKQALLRKAKEEEEGKRKKPPSGGSSGGGGADGK